MGGARSDRGHLLVERDDRTPSWLAAYHQDIIPPVELTYPARNSPPGSSVRQSPLPLARSYLDDLAFAYAQDYIQRVMDQLSETFRSAIDAASEMKNEVNAMPPSELAQRPHLLTTAQALVALHEVIPDDQYRTPRPH